MADHAQAVQDLWEAVLGEKRRQTHDFQEVLAALDAGNDPMLELPWYASGDRNTIVLKVREGDRIHFYNPQGHPGAAVGQELVDGPPRRLESDGLESMSLVALKALFGQDGWGLLKA